MLFRISRKLSSRVSKMGSRLMLSRRSNALQEKTDSRIRRQPHRRMVALKMIFQNPFEFSEESNDIRFIERFLCFIKLMF